MTDPAWQTAPWSTPFIDIEGETKPAPRHETRFKLLWDDQFLYLAAWLQEPHIWATYTEHDSIVFHENDFEMFLDPDGDGHRYYEWEINALGTTFDLFMAKPYRANCDYDPSWETTGATIKTGLKGTLNDPSDIDLSWFVEAAFPWACFDRDRDLTGKPPRSGDQWRINFSRVQWDLDIVDGAYQKLPNRPEHNWVWSPQGLIDMHVPWMWGYVQFEDFAETPFCPDQLHETKMALAAEYWTGTATGDFQEASRAVPGGELVLARDLGFALRQT